MTKNWWILILALKSLTILHFDQPFLVVFDLKKLSFMTLESDAKFEEKLTCGFENNMKNLANFHQSTWKSQNWDFDGILCPKLKIYELKIYRGVICHDNEEWCKNWIASSKLTWGIWRILIQALANLKNLHFTGLPLKNVLS